MSIAIQYPHNDTAVYSITLKNPDLANPRIKNLRTQFIRLANDTHISYKQTTNTNRLQYTFNGLKFDKFQEVLLFLNMTSGKKIKLTDYDSVDWYGFIITHPHEATTIKDGVMAAVGSSSIPTEYTYSCGAYNITLEFIVTTGPGAIQYLTNEDGDQVYTVDGKAVEVN